MNKFNLILLIILSSTSLSMNANNDKSKLETYRKFEYKPKKSLISDDEKFQKDISSVKKNVPAPNKFEKAKVWQHRAVTLPKANMGEDLLLTVENVNDRNLQSP